MFSGSNVDSNWLFDICYQSWFQVTDPAGRRTLSQRVGLPVKAVGPPAPPPLHFPPRSACRPGPPPGGPHQTWTGREKLIISPNSVKFLIKKRLDFKIMHHVETVTMAEFECCHDCYYLLYDQLINTLFSLSKDCFKYDTIK